MLEILSLFACPGKIFTVLIQLTWWKTRPFLHFRHINPLFLISAILTLFQLVWQSVHIPKNRASSLIRAISTYLRQLIVSAIFILFHLMIRKSLQSFLAQFYWIIPFYLGIFVLSSAMLTLLLCDSNFSMSSTSFHNSTVLTFSRFMCDFHIGCFHPHFHWLTLCYPVAGLGQPVHVGHIHPHCHHRGLQWQQDAAWPEGHHGL